MFRYFTFLTFFSLYFYVYILYESKMTSWMSLILQFFLFLKFLQCKITKFMSVNSNIKNLCGSFPNFSLFFSLSLSAFCYLDLISWYVLWFNEFWTLCIKNSRDICRLLISFSSKKYLLLVLVGRTRDRADAQLCLRLCESWASLTLSQLLRCSHQGSHRNPWVPWDQPKLSAASQHLCLLLYAQLVSLFAFWRLTNTSKGKAVLNVRLSSLSFSSL